MLLGPPTPSAVEQLAERLQIAQLAQVLLAGIQRIRDLLQCRFPLGHRRCRLLLGQPARRFRRHLRTQLGGERGEAFPHGCGVQHTG